MAVSMEIDGYRDLKLIATGRDGIVYSVVYKATQAGTGRAVALKILTTAGPDALEVATRLGRSHPGIVTVLDTRVLPDGRACVVTQYHDEGSLDDRLRARGPLPHTDVIAIGEAVASALAFAHRQGVVHGNLKPQKVFATPESYALAGLGLHGAATVADDIHALGSMLYTLLGGQVPDSLAPVLTRCRSPRPEDRFPDAPSLRDALSALRAPVPAAPGVWLIPAPKPTPAEQPDFDLPYDPAPLIAPTPVPSVDGPPVPSVSGPPVPSVDGLPVPSVSGPLASSVDGLPVPSVSGSPASSVDGLPVPSVSGSPASSVYGLPVPSVSGSPASSVYGLPVPSVGGPPVPSVGGPAARPGPSWPRLAVLAVISLLLGGSLTIGLAWVRGLNAAPAASKSSLSPTGPPPIVVHPARANDPAIAPEITEFTDRGTSLALTWTDRSGGKASFVVVEVTGSAAVPLTQVEAGRTTVVVERIDPARQSCLAVLAVTETAQAISPLRCG